MREEPYDLDLGAVTPISKQHFYHVILNPENHVVMDEMMPGRTDLLMNVSAVVISSNYSQSQNLSNALEYPIAVNRYVMLALFLLTFIFGLLGNTLTIVVILRNSRMKTVASCFILNLAIADCLFILR